MFESIDTPALEAKLVALAGRLAAAQCRFLLLLAEFDAREGWAGPGVRSCSHWLSWRIGLSRRTARDQLRVARALAALPSITEAFGAGRLSYAKVRAITRVATTDTERELLDVALAGTAGQVERVVRSARRSATGAAEATSRRAASWRWDEDGYLVLRATLPPEQGALLLAALEAQLGEAEIDAGGGVDGGVDGAPGVAGTARAPGRMLPDRPGPPGAVPQPRSAPESGSAEPPSGERVGPDLAIGLERSPGAAADRSAARRADALMALLAPDAGHHHVVVHVDAEHGRATLDDGTAIATASAHRLACGASIRALVSERAGNPLYLGRSHRSVSATQLAALRIRDQGRCAFPGCEHRRFLHAHHLRHWLHGGSTDIDNLALMCGFHHRLVHDQGYRTWRARDGLRVRRPDGTEVTAQHPASGTDPRTTGELSVLDLLVEQHVADDAIVPSWSGEPLDLDAVLAAILPPAAVAA
ncbi:MAG TPA: DUF222 domain-containing protein [Pseudonocardia sp.]